jgi:hypothetical protein
MQVVLSETNINEQAQFVYDFFKPECEAKNIELSLHKALSDTKATIITDAEKLYAVLTNLVKNSIKYTDQGKIEIGYRLSENIPDHPEQQNTQRIEFYVSDTGIGIPLHRQNAIFDRFVQADLSDVRAFEGAGLGLSITKAYVEMLNGELWVKSEEKKGSVFYFTLPYLKAQTRVEELFITSKPNNKRSSKDLKVLIVDDDKTSEILVTLAVQPFSRDVLLANRGHQAIEICRQHPDIDLILMDIKMPDMDGYETTSHIRKFNEKVVIIAQTAFGLADEKEKALEIGCNDFIMKPINIEQLKKLIARYFEIA